MGEYLILIYGDESAWEALAPGAMDEMSAEHQKFQANNASALRGGNALQPSSTATSVRRDSSGKVNVTDGPFAETKEALGGYYLIEAPDLDAALAIASQIPAPDGGVEVRPIRVFG